jgi:two-component system cell cycle response regulator
MTKILIIEDDAGLIDLYKIVFSRHEYEVISAYDGEMGLQKALEIIPAVILLDIMMPRMNGLDVLKSLKTNESTKNIPVIVLTNLTDAALEQQALVQGATQYLLKSQYLPNELVEIVDKVLNIV